MTRKGKQDYPGSHQEENVIKQLKVHVGMCKTYYGMFRGKAKDGKSEGTK